MVIVPYDDTRGATALRATAAGVIEDAGHNPSSAAWPTWAVVGASAVAGLAVFGATVWVVGRIRGRRIEYPWPAPANQGIAFAEGAPRPVWPVANNSTHARRLEVPYEDVSGNLHGNAARRFRATRDGRFHVGVDLYANAGDVVLAPEAGVIVQTQSFLNGTDAMLIQGEHGVTVLLGEIAPGSWKEMGVAEGSTVERGQPVARVGRTHNGSHMLHFETYACCPTKNFPWYKGHDAPELVRDPTDYLLRALAGEMVA